MFALIEFFVWLRENFGPAQEGPENYKVGQGCMICPD